VGLDGADGHYVVRLDGDRSVSCRTVVVASGAQYRKLNVPRLEEFERASVYYAATLMEARLCAGEPVAVVGGGNSAGQGTLFLAKHAKPVRLIVRESSLTQNMSRYLADRIERNPDIELLLNTEVRELAGPGVLREVVVENNKTGERRTLEAHALFVFIGVTPCTQRLAGQLAVDDHGFVLTGPDIAAHAAVGDAATLSGAATLAGADAGNGTRSGAGAGNGEAPHRPALLETSWPGVFAAGDVRSGSVKRVASAVGEGAMAVHFIHRHLQLSGAGR
jgi:thioredoxin reductase (NADPH)